MIASPSLGEDVDPGSVGRGLFLVLHPPALGSFGSWAGGPQALRFPPCDALERGVPLARRDPPQARV